MPAHKAHPLDPPLYFFGVEDEDRWGVAEYAHGCIQSLYWTSGLDWCRTELLDSVFFLFHLLVNWLYVDYANLM